MKKSVPSLAAAFGQAVRDHRRTLGFSQEELAWRSGLNRSYVTDVERGARNPSLATMEKLAQALETSLHKLLRDMDMVRERMTESQKKEPRQ